MGEAARTLHLPPIVRETLDRFVSGLRDRFGERLAEVRLFGSYARGEAHEDSDVDCLVLIDGADRRDDRAVTDLAADLIWQVGGVVIFPIVMSPSEFNDWKARERATPLAIEREGVRL
jgi:uncharacterized protein